MLAASYLLPSRFTLTRMNAPATLVTSWLRNASVRRWIFGAVAGWFITWANMNAAEYHQRHSISGFWEFDGNDEPAAPVRNVQASTSGARQRLPGAGAAGAPFCEEVMSESLQFENHLLSRMSPTDIGLLAPHLERHAMNHRFQYEHSRKAIEHIYFPESGLSSVVVVGRGDTQIEAGLFGREGMSGIAVIMGSDRSVHTTFVQVAGEDFGSRVMRYATRWKRVHPCAICWLIMRTLPDSGLLHRFGERTSHDRGKARTLDADGA
jgi:hypothetical protein